MPLSPAVELVEEPSAADRERILAGLRQFNAARATPGRHETLCLRLQGDGGLWGVTAFDWLVIELLFVPEELRGQGLGTALLERAEQEARARGCIGAWLDTFSFQARGFYEKLGYGLAGTIPEPPIGGARYFLMKRWGG